MAVGAMGAKLHWAETTPAAETTLVGEIVSWSGPAWKAAVIDVTHLQSTAKEKLLGIYDVGQLSLDINFVGTGDLGQKSLRSSLISRVRGGWKITLSSVTTSQNFVGKGYVSGFSVQGSVDNIIKASVTIEIHGGVSWNT
jgi:hypothetical protein